MDAESDIVSEPKILSILAWVTGSTIIERGNNVEESDLRHKRVVPFLTEFGILVGYPGEGLPGKFEICL